jgi:hypothetical protein
MAYKYVARTRRILTRFRENSAVSRASNVPYHQNVYDLLQLDPGVCPKASRLIAAHEARFGPLPASLREWYLVPGVVSTERRGWESAVGWYGNNDDPPRSLPRVLAQFARRPTDVPRSYICFMDGHIGECRYFFKLNATTDPPVYDDYGRRDHLQWKRLADTFSAYLMDCFVHNHQQNLLLRPHMTAAGIERITYPNSLWLRCPLEPFPPPVIDFLTDHFGEPERTPRPRLVTTYTFRPPGGTIRVTADEPSRTGAMSAWWVHADTSERLAEFGRLLLPWGTLRDALRADTEGGRDALRRIRGERGA